MSQPRIVILDGYALNPGDLSWQSLEALGDCVIFERTTPEELVERARGAQIVLTNKVPLSREAILALPELEYIGVTATGYNVVDVETAAEQKVVVTNVPTYGTSSVAQMVFAHLLNLTQRVADHASAVRTGRWASASDWCFWDSTLMELSGQTLGIVGFGRIGRAVARIAQAFEMNVLVSTRSVKELPVGVRSVDLETLFSESDVVSLHCPLTPETDRLVNRERLAQMKSTAFLINTGRGALIDEAALIEALESGEISGAGLDVLLQEPPSEDYPLVSAKNCFITPHIAWATKSSRSRLLDTSVQNVAAFLAGKPQNVVN
ncbi:MAG: D-2-hydroxyacid dehydrogenase [Planctomycetales bacterium]|nr:D-2-hydroxyacid dehydrogenase [Planctomycetales bacterium]